eukprot:Nk52_evm5s245 gene=Nk52_evmTU5s245
MDRKKLSSLVQDTKGSGGEEENAFKQLLTKYFNQLKQGCGDSTCDNPHCASNPNFKPLNNNECAAAALKLSAQGGRLCIEEKNQARYNESDSMYVKLKKRHKGDAEKRPERLTPELVDNCVETESVEAVINAITASFSSFKGLTKGFLKSQVICEDAECPVDMELVRGIYHSFNKLEKSNAAVASGMKVVYFEALTSLAKEIEIIEDSLTGDASYLHPFVIVLENEWLLDPEYHSVVMPQLCRVLAHLSRELQNTLAEWWSHFPVESFHKLVSIFQQFITMRLLSGLIGEGSVPNHDEPIQNATRCLGILYKANQKKTPTIISYQEFHNDAINEQIELKEDYPLWKTGDGFSFCNYPFILDTATKGSVLRVENQVKQRQELQEAFFRSIFGGPHNPYLTLKVRRNYIIQDALAQISRKSENSSELKKQLRVQFVGEEGVDEGGVQKEFFQLIVREIFDPKYGMFTLDEDTRMYWFNPTSLETEEEYELIGLIIGLAIYNSVILDLHFPMVVYKMLLGMKGALDDLKESHPSLGRGLQQLLDFDGDIKETFHQTFQVDYEHFGDCRTYELKPAGSSIFVDQANKKEYVDLYVDYIYRVSIEKQFHAFRTGFEKVTANSALSLFLYEELELLVCGSSCLDFEDLEKVTKYDGGFKEDTPVIKFFWEVVHELTDDQKKKLLFFATGSDRVPIGGLSKLSFVITKNGPDSDRLPTAHTCFNVLLLCEYSNKAKLKERLLTAIQNAEGFGMI